jgi:hypothetical protein
MRLLLPTIRKLPENKIVHTALMEVWALHIMDIKGTIAKLMVKVRFRSA